jgi:alpha-tubulin suppressor-like RCC1 family protein
MNLRRGFSSLAEHSVFVTPEGTVYSWGKQFISQVLDPSGSNRTGSLGVGDIENHNDPCIVSLPAALVSVACGEHHTVALLEDGSVYAWGNNTYGQAGKDIALGCVSTPHHVPLEEPIVSVFAGASYSIAITKEGALFVWGAANFLLGRNTATPTRVPNSGDFVEVSCGWGHMAGLTRDGRAYIWGLLQAPSFISIPEEVTSLASGTGFSIMLGVSGRVYSVGNNNYVTPQDSESSEKPSVLYEGGVSAIAGGGNHVLLLLEDGGVIGWGWNIYGQIGTGNSDGVHQPTRIPFPPPLPSTPSGEPPSTSSDEPPSEPYCIGCGWGFSWIVTKDNSLYVWGSANRGYFGRSDAYTPMLAPIKVALPKLAKEEIWQKTLSWLLLGRIDEASILFGIPMEVLWNLLKLEYCGRY